MEENYKRKVCMIGPFPPPINGNSKALDTIVRSTAAQEQFDFEIVNLYKLYEGKTGKLSLSKVIGLRNLKKTIRLIRKQEKINTYYISISQTLVGCIRDIAVIKEILKQKQPYKLVLHLHGGGLQKFYQDTNSIMRFLVRKYYSYADTGIVLGESLKNMFDGIISKEKIIVIPNCVDNEMLLSEEEIDRKILALKSKEDFQVLYLSNMIETKGYKDLFEAAVKYHENRQNLNFVFAGAFKEENDKIDFLKAIEANNAKDYIKYVGVVGGKEKRDLLFTSDIFVLPTYYPNEGQPISIIECMSAGMAIISTNHAGIADLVMDGFNGFFVSAKNSDSIVDVLTKISKKEELLKLSKNSREKAMRSYTEEKYIGKICDVLR